jgi:Transglycosylase SLT domain
LRPPVPHLDGPLGSSGAAPGDRTPAPRGDHLSSAPAAVSAGEAEPGATAERSSEANPAATTEPAANAEPAADAEPAAKARPAADAEAAAKAEPAGTAEAQPTAETKPAGTAETEAAGTAEAEPAEAGSSGGAADTVVDDTVVDDTAAAVVRTSSGRRVTRMLRQANLARVARTAGRNTSAWARRPTGRLILPAIIAVLLLGAAGTAGAYLVPEALQAQPAPRPTPGFPLEAAPPALAAPTGSTGPPSIPAASGLPTPSAASTRPGVTGARPADALAGWAQQVGTRAGIPVVAVEAYGYAELVLNRTAPNCHLSWTTIAALGEVESAHGSAGGAVLGADGSVQPPIYGLPLDGKGGRQLIRDTDHGAIDGDTTYDRAVGPLQFIPSTWQSNAVDADNSGAADPNDIDDASLTAAIYLCRNGRDMSKPEAWWDAILSYNAVRPYAQKVFDAANEYGQRSRI